MDKKNAIESLSALAQDIRLDVFRLLVQAGPEGLHAGDIAARLDVRQNTLSTNLAVLSRAGLIQASREGRSIRYRADLEGMRALLGFLMEDCCGGKPEACRPLLDAIACC
ncbi:ArsR/SmtB family transcription factor [Oceanibaculum pacificum]|uniref:ArsR family transcriptional regulator n=1 Tax=Oceanibaculum pacificum TaxID=580166 RepID=A0A154WG84_9PROT|nr:metalloregulator ArsR/SmtB family transcription factor [Oceanibaculum pacificum]KZD12540.1 ArsR family transcriptional regulator [Oceanibaculum pacificum]